MPDPDERLGSVGSCKRGDVGSTNDAYAEAYLGDAAALQADAITVHPFLGLGAMDAFVSRAAESGSCLLVVARSSNPAGREVQAATTSAGWSVEAELLGRIAGLNERLAPGEIGPIGAVVWPTHLDPALDLVRSNCLFLAPGVGAQGATPRDVQQVFAACKREGHAERVALAARPPRPRTSPRRRRGARRGVQGTALSWGISRQSWRGLAFRVCHFAFRGHFPAIGKVPDPLGPSCRYGPHTITRAPPWRAGARDS